MRLRGLRATHLGGICKIVRASRAEETNKFSRRAGPAAPPLIYTWDRIKRYINPSLSVVRPLRPAVSSSLSGPAQTLGAPLPNQYELSAMTQCQERLK